MRTRGLSFNLFLAVGLVLAFGFGQPARADLAGLGAVDAVTGFPRWFEDAVGLRVQLCDEFDPGLPAEEQPPCIPELIDPNGGIVDGNIGEALFYAAAAEFPGPAGESILAQCILEAAGPELPGDTNTVGNVALLRIDNLTVEGDYTVVTPCGQFTFNVPNDVPVNGRFTGETNDTLGLPTDNPPYSGALLGAVQIFASNGTGTAGFLGDGETPGPLSSPLRPGGGTIITFSRNGVLLATGDQFTVVGKLSGCTDDNLPPTANPDQDVTMAESAVTINVLANDSDVVVQFDELGAPTPVVVTPPLGTVAIVANSIAPPGSGTAAVNPDNTVTFTPAAGFFGPASFQYTLTDPCGLASPVPATVTVFVENLLANAADYRVRTGRWSLSGSSNFRDLFLVDGTQTTYYTGLTGAQENPPVTSAATGEFMAIFDSTTPAAFNYNLQVNVPVGTTFNRAHIHAGAQGVNGGILFTLCDAAISPCTVSNGVISLSGTLTATEFSPAGGLTNFAEAVAAIQAGGTYVNVHSTTNPGGEIRGQIGRNVVSLRVRGNGAAIGAAEVQESAGDNKPWSFGGKSAASLGAAPHMIEAESALGVPTTRVLRLR